MYIIYYIMEVFSQIANPSRQVLPSIVYFRTLQSCFAKFQLHMFKIKHMKQVQNLHFEYIKLVFIETKYDFFHKINS